MADFISILYNWKNSREITLDEVVAQSHFELWRPGMEVVATGDYLVLGVSIANRYDLQLLDILDNAIGSGQIKHAHVSVFDWTDLNPAVLEPDVPHLGLPYHSPLACLWIEGRLANAQWGYAAKKFVCDRYRLPLDEVHRLPIFPKPR
jgi:hypothetical protein